MLLRFNDNGSLDPTFGSGGTVTTSFGGAATWGVALAFQADGKLLAGGLTSSDSYFQNSDFALARYETGGFVLTGAVSRKIHGGAGTFDINLPLSGAPGVECRDGAGHHTFVFTFNSNIADGSVSVAGGSGTMSRSPTFVGNTMSVDVANVSDVQTLTLMLSNVTDEFSRQLPPTSINVNMLIGDTNGNKSVNTSDIGQSKGQSGGAVTSANFRQDVNANGVISASDIALVKSKAGNTLP